MIGVLSDAVHERRQGMCIEVGCPAVCRSTTTMSGAVIIQHGDDPEHRREFAARTEGRGEPTVFDIGAWFDTLHAHQGYSREGARLRREQGSSDGA